MRTFIVHAWLNSNNGLTDFFFIQISISISISTPDLSLTYEVSVLFDPNAKRRKKETETDKIA